mgnify:CR=1 FL=1
MATNNFSGFSIKPVKKVRAKVSSTPIVKQALYCKPVYVDDELVAHINTRGVYGYEKVTILPFSKESFDLRGKTHIFVKNKNSDGKYVHIIRSKDTAEMYPGNDEIYTPICENSIYKGYIVKHDNKLAFKVTEYVSTIKANDLLLTKNNIVNEH